MLEKTRGIILHQIKYSDSGIVATDIYKEVRKAILSYQRNEEQENRQAQYPVPANVHSRS